MVGDSQAGRNMKILRAMHRTVDPMDVHGVRVLDIVDLCAARSRLEFISVPLHPGNLITPNQPRTKMTPAQQHGLTQPSHKFGPAFLALAPAEGCRLCLCLSHSRTNGQLVPRGQLEAVQVKGDALHVLLSFASRTGHVAHCGSPTWLMESIHTNPLRPRPHDTPILCRFGIV